MLTSSLETKWWNITISHTYNTTKLEKTEHGNTSRHFTHTRTQNEMEWKRKKQGKYWNKHFSGVHIYSHLVVDAVIVAGVVVGVLTAAALYTPLAVKYISSGHISFVIFTLYKCTMYRRNTRVCRLIFEFVERIWGPVPKHRWYQSETKRLRIYFSRFVGLFQGHQGNIRDIGVE